MKWRILLSVLFVTSVQQVALVSLQDGIMVYSRLDHVHQLRADSVATIRNGYDSERQDELQDILSSGFKGSNRASGELECINVKSVRYPNYVVFHVCRRVSHNRHGAAGKELLITGVDGSYVSRIFININHIKGKYGKLIFKNIDFKSMHLTQIAHYKSIEFYNCTLYINEIELEFGSIQNASFINSKFLFSGKSRTTILNFHDIDNLKFIGSEFSYLADIRQDHDAPLTSPKLIVRGCANLVSFSNCHAFIIPVYDPFLGFDLSSANDNSGRLLVFDLRSNLCRGKMISFQNVKFLGVALLLEHYDVIHFNQCEIQGQCKIANLLPDGSSIVNSQFMNTKPLIRTSGKSSILTLKGAKMDIIDTAFHNCESDYIIFQVGTGAEFPAADLSLKNVTFSNNTGTQIYSTVFGSQSMQQQPEDSLTLENVSFLNNEGLPIHIDGAYIVHLFNVDFTDNVGAIAIYNEHISLEFSNVRIRSKRLITDHGGDIYISVNTALLDFSLTADNVFFETVEDANCGIYIDNRNDCSPSSISSHFKGITTKFLKTSAHNIIQSQDYIGMDMFTGKSLYVPAVFNITDCLGNDAWCNANPTLVYNNTENCTIDINHDKLILLETRKDLTTEIYLTLVSACHLPTNVTLILTCEDVSTAINLTLRDCPLGYTVSNPHSQQVVCEASDDIVSDDSKEHIACIERDYWYGEMNSTSGHSRMIKSPCGPPYCVNDIEACPIDGYTDTHQILPWTQDEQCNGYYGGVLCRSCREQAVFTFGASKCVSLSKCKQWQPYLIICLAIVGQIVLTLVMICSGAKTKVGVGYLYGPLFFVAVYKLLPISNMYFLLTSPLEMTFSVYESIFLLDLDVLGKVNWCFFNLDEAIHYSMRFIGPLITFLVLLVVVLIAKNSFCYKFRINRIIQSPIQPMCLLIMLSFWSLSKTSIEIIKPIVINGEWRFAIQPEYAYLGNGYIIGLFCISVVLLTIFYLPFILLLLSSQFIRRKINLFRIQPFLDAFQSSYKDNCQWFSGVYLLSWLILNIELPPYAFIIVFFSISAIHFTVHPHKSTFLNVADSLLLVDMLILSSLSYFSEDHTIMVIKYPLLIIPLMYILMGGVWISIRGIVQKYMNKYRYPIKNDDSVMQELMVPVEDVIDSGDIVPQDIIIARRQEMEREPLIYDD